jgi:hypothetical protein
MKAPRKQNMTRVAAAASWTALVAASLGFSSVDRVRAEIATDHLGGDGSFRLVVQSYALNSLTEDDLPSRYARPLASTQRAVTAEELRHGVAVDLMQIDASPNAPVVVAWVEPGDPDLEFDALRARPSAAAHYGVGSPGARLVLRRRSA